jgi:hypothetical protein
MKTIDTINLVLTNGQSELNSALSCNAKARSAIQSSMNRILGDIAMTYTDRDASLALFGNAIAEVLAVRGYNSADYELVANKSLRSRIEAAVKNVYGFKGAATLVYQAPKKSKNGVKTPSIPCQHEVSFPDMDAPFRVGVAVAVATVKGTREDDTHDDPMGDVQSLRDVEEVRQQVVDSAEQIETLGEANVKLVNDNRQLHAQIDSTVRVLESTATQRDSWKTQYEDARVDLWLATHKRRAMAQEMRAVRRELKTAQAMLALASTKPGRARKVTA